MWIFCFWETGTELKCGFLKFIFLGPGASLKVGFKAQLFEHSGINLKRVSLKEYFEILKTLQNFDFLMTFMELSCWEGLFESPSNYDFFKLIFEALGSVYNFDFFLFGRSWEHF